jgi:hypothetical protein
MPRPYSQDLRDRVVMSVAGGRSRRATAKTFSVSVATVVSDCPGGQAEYGSWARTSRALALRRTRSLWARAIRITLFGLPARVRGRWKSASAAGSVRRRRWLSWAGRNAFDLGKPGDDPAVDAIGLFEKAHRLGAAAHWSSGKVDTGLCGFAVGLLWGDVAESGVDPPMIVIAFDVSEQVAPCGIMIGIVALVDELGFQGAEEALHRGRAPGRSATECAETRHFVGLRKSARRDPKPSLSLHVSLGPSCPISPTGSEIASAALHSARSRKTFQ